MVILSLKSRLVRSSEYVCLNREIGCANEVRKKILVSQQDALLPWVPPLFSSSLGGALMKCQRSELRRA